MEARVLDLFAGSGALGIEALSRYMATQEGLSVIALRIGGFQPSEDARGDKGLSMLDAFVSQEDLQQLLEQCIDDTSLQFALFNALSATTAAADLPVGLVRADAIWRGRLEACTREGVAVAAAEGAPIDLAQALREYEETDPDQRTSMQVDVDSGREPELDAIQGAILRAAARNGLPAPTTAHLAGLIARRAGVPAPVG